MSNGAHSGSHPVNPPAGPGANHFQNFNLAMKKALESRPSAGDYEVRLQVTVNPGSIKDYKVVLRPV
jgi:hypothetical protein